MGEAAEGLTPFLASSLRTPGQRLQKRGATSGVALPQIAWHREKSQNVQGSEPE